ncbi:MAG: zinc ribbon domain-containing protein [Thermoplasmata archaeon]
MSSLTSTEIIALVFVVVLAVIVVGLFVYLIRRLRSRRAKLLSDLEDRPQLNQDRAFNRLSMARREAGILAAQGVDVHRAQELIAESQGAFDTRQYDRSYRVAQSAHEALVNARQHGTMTPGAPLPSKGPAASAPPDTSRLPSGATSTSEPPPSATPPIPKNRAESQFQMRLLSDELSALGGARARDPAVAGANALRAQAQSAFDRGDYTEAFRVALRGRRTLGGSVESLPAVTGGTSSAARAPPNGNATTLDAARTAESVAGSERCPDCGYPALSGDSFCRGCGRPRAPLTCPSCGAARVGGEAFCGRCGARFP